MSVDVPTNEPPAGCEIDSDDFSDFSCSCREDVVATG